MGIETLAIVVGLSATIGGIAVNVIRSLFSGYRAFDTRFDELEEQERKKLYDIELKIASLIGQVSVLSEKIDLLEAKNNQIINNISTSLSNVQSALLAINSHFLSPTEK